MSEAEQAECTVCKDTTTPLKGGTSIRWERQDSPELHYMATAPAMRRRQWASEEKVAPLRDQIDAIHRKGRVAWLDVKDNGEFVLYHAPHGTVPGNIPQTPR